MICQKIKCSDYLTDDGDPAWCYWAGQPAEVAVLKCPKAGNQNGRNECQLEDRTTKIGKRTV